MTHRGRRELIASCLEWLDRHPEFGSAASPVARLAWAREQVDRFLERAAAAERENEAGLARIREDIASGAARRRRRAELRAAAEEARARYAPRSLSADPFRDLMRRWRNRRASSWSYR